MRARHLERFINSDDRLALLAARELARDECSEVERGADVCGVLQVEVDLELVERHRERLQIVFVEEDTG